MITSAGPNPEVGLRGPHRSRRSVPVPNTLEDALDHLLLVADVVGVVAGVVSVPGTAEPVNLQAIQGDGTSATHDILYTDLQLSGRGLGDWSKMDRFTYTSHSPNTKVTSI